MTKVISLRLPNALAAIVRQNAERSIVPVANFVGVILEHSLNGAFNLAHLPDVCPLDGKLDIRLPEQLVLNVHEASKRIGKSVSVYSRIIFVCLLHEAIEFRGDWGPLHTSGKP
jgi:hypothetical protein